VSQDLFDIHFGRNLLGEMMATQSVKL